MAHVLDLGISVSEVTHRYVIKIDEPPDYRNDELSYDVALNEAWDLFVREADDAYGVINHRMHTSWWGDGNPARWVIEVTQYVDPTEIRIMAIENLELALVIYGLQESE